MAEAEMDRAFWERQTRVANVLNIGIVVLNLAYALATWSTGPNRPLLAGINIVVLVGVVAMIATVPPEQLVRSEQRPVIFALWALSGSALVTVASALDGGLSSPMAWLLPISVMFAASVHRALLVLSSAAAGLAGYVVLALIDGRFADDPWGALLPAGYLVALGYAGTMNARFRWGHYDEQVALRAELSFLADHDGLTGLLNHRAFRSRLAEVLAASATDSSPVAVLAIDLDHFKAVNDAHGHARGDEVLVAAAGAIREATREGDVLGRVGGEEFAVALPGADPETGAFVAERIRRAIAAAGQGSPWMVTASVGLSAFPRDGTLPTPLLDAADRALYVAKRAGRNQVRSTAPAA